MDMLPMRGNHACSATAQRWRARRGLIPCNTARVHWFSCSTRVGQAPARYSTWFDRACRRTWSRMFDPGVRDSRGSALGLLIRLFTVTGQCTAESGALASEKSTTRPAAGVVLSVPMPLPQPDVPSRTAFASCCKRGGARGQVEEELVKTSFVVGEGDKS